MDVSDFDVTEGGFPQISGTQKSYHTLYAIEMSKLAILRMSSAFEYYLSETERDEVGRVLKTEFAAGRRSNPHESEILARELKCWEQQVSPKLALGQLDGTLGAPFWARMLYASFKYAIQQPLLTLLLIVI